MNNSWDFRSKSLFSCSGFRAKIPFGDSVCAKPVNASLKQRKESFQKDSNIFQVSDCRGFNTLFSLQESWYSYLLLPLIFIQCVLFRIDSAWGCSHSFRPWEACSLDVSSSSLWTVQLSCWAPSARVCWLTSAVVTLQITTAAFHTDCWLKSAGQVRPVRMIWTPVQKVAQNHNPSKIHFGNINIDLLWRCKLINVHKVEQMNFIFQPRN